MAVLPSSTMTEHNGTEYEYQGTVMNFDGDGLSIARDDVDFYHITLVDNVANSDEIEEDATILFNLGDENGFITEAVIVDDEDITENNTPEYETYTEQVTKHFTEIEGVKVRTDVLIDFLEELKGSDRLLAVRWSHEYTKAAEALEEAGLVNVTNAGDWYSDDDEAIDLLHEQLVNGYLDRTD